MQVKGERDALMQVICETTTSKTEKIRVAAFDCLVSVASLYYGLMTEYMVPLYNATMQAMANDSDEVCQSAIEFWSTLCDEELEMIEWGEEDQKNMHYVKGACKDLVPALLSQLTKQVCLIRARTLPLDSSDGEAATRGVVMIQNQRLNIRLGRVRPGMVQADL